ncbi:ASCH domain-containing protein [Winogradskyella litoriviva]|uniref:ASCH domain-containing protein n=1 Tax=Winogradskyella litoriviva TaxID=1220182 RepID=A0ABX2E3A6_9FLAO|nr:ASCH domain-containing protein [Winogradskyella litoriviva]NRD22446.1 ASCH domain-containing protein [Winogradskyella litoriviva]
MKRTAIILLLILINCKNETVNTVENTVNSEVNAKNTIDQSVTDMWQSYTSSNPEFKNDDMPESSYFHNNEADANRLAELVVSGKKKAGSGLYYMYKEAKVDLPRSGTKHIITNFSGKAKAIIEIVKVDTIPFNKITKEYASIDIGTNIEPLKKWRKAHWDFFSSVFIDSNKKPTENMLVVCEWFKTIWINNDM